MRILAFGTYDVRTHPRVGVLVEGLRARGDEVVEINLVLGIDTAARVAMLRQPWRLPLLALRLARCWAVLAVRGRREWRRQRPDAVLVGYLGHFDVLLARLLFGRAVIVLDHLIFAADTATDRGESWSWKVRLLAALDRQALAAADVVVVDSEEHGQLVPAGPGRAAGPRAAGPRAAGPRAALPSGAGRGGAPPARTPALADRVVVVPVGATAAWFAAGDAAGPRVQPDVLRVVFFGLFTPLQGTPALGRALGLLAGDPRVRVTMIGRGQDRAEAQRLAAGNPRVEWVDWVPAARLPELVAGHDVCLGIFGTGAKAGRVVPNKVYQGAAAGCAVVTSDTRPQRSALGDAARFVAPGDAAGLAAVLSELAADSSALEKLRAAARDRAGERFAAAAVVSTLRQRLGSATGTVPPTSTPPTPTPTPPTPTPPS